MRKRDCGLERRISRLQQLEIAADRALPRDGADVVLRLIADELRRLGIFALTLGPVDETDTIH